jgi:hypothetical protein
MKTGAVGAEEMKQDTEVKSLLQFFAQSRDEQKAQLPPSIPKVWVDTHGMIDTPTHKPAHLLVLVLYSHLCKAFEEFADANDLLVEIGGLLLWMIEKGRDSDFDYADEEVGTVDSYDTIWKVLRRLCRLALACPSVQQHERAELSFQYFLETYTSPIPQEEFQQWTHRR